MGRWKLLFGVGTLMIVFLPIIIVLAGSVEWRKEQERARARRFADARMNARLLRLNV